MPEDFYDLFDIEEDASRDDVTRAYRAMVREYHPDNNDDPMAKEQFKTIRVARDTLIEDRERYEAYGHARYAEEYLDMSLDGFEFTAEPEERDDVPTPSRTTSTSETSSQQQSKDTQQEKEESSEETTIGVQTEQQEVTQEQSTTSTQEQTTTTSKETTPETPEVAETPSNEVVFKPKPDTSVLNMCWLVLATLSLYLVGIADYIRDNQIALAQLLAENPFGSERFGLETFPTLMQDVIATPANDPFAILVPTGMVFLPLAIAVMVARFGNRRTLWLYVIGATIPGLFVLYEAFTTPSLPAAEAAVYVVLPLLVVTVFISDVIGGLIKRYIRYYWQRYVAR